MREQKIQILNLILNLMIIFLIFCNISVFIFKIDFTKNNAFTISQVTKDLFRDANEKIYITYYNSGSLENYYAFPEQIKNFLTTFADTSRGKVIYKNIDADNVGTPLEQIGIPSQQIDLREANQMSVLKIYSGIEIIYEGKREIIPVISELTNLEYALANKIDKLINNTNKVLGIAFGDDSLKEVHRSLVDLMQKAFGVEIKEINLVNDEIKDIDGLFVIGAKNINENIKEKIEDYIMDDGKLFFTASKIEYNPQNPYSTAPINSPIFDLFREYGVEYDNNIILDTKAPKILLGGNIQTYYPWILLDKSNLGKDSGPLLNNFYDATMPWTNSIKLTKPENQDANYKTLFHSSTKSWEITKDFTSISFQIFEASEKFDENEKLKALGISIEGKIKSSKTSKMSENSKIILFGSSMVFSDYMYNISPSNFELAGRISDYLMKKEEFFNIKSREVRSKLNFGDSLNGMANAKLSLIIVNLIILPLIVLGVGIIRFSRRKRKIS